MSKAGSFFKKLIHWEYFPLLVAFGGLLALHAFILLNVGDDAYFSQALKDLDLFNYLALRYQGWTSRLIIEVATVGFAYNTFLFRLVNPLFFILLIYSMYKLMPGEKSKARLWLLIGLCALLPKAIFNGTGWVATNVNYLWTVALGLYALLPVQKLLAGEKLKGYQVFLTLLAVLYASNHELMMAALFAVYVPAFLWQLIRRRFEPVLLAGVMIILGNLALILLAPGNLSRFQSEVATWFPLYSSLSLFQKFFAGFSSTMFEFVMEPNLIFLVFGLSLFSLSLLGRNSLRVRIAAALPAGSVLLFGFVGSLFPGSPLGLLRSLVDVDGTTVTWAYFSVYWPTALYLLVIVSAACSLYAVLKDRKKSLPLLAGLGLGLVIRLMMSNSPTVWGSGERTFLLLYSALILAAAYLAGEASKKLMSAYKKQD